jgi:hypothetical protein
LPRMPPGHSVTLDMASSGRPTPSAGDTLDNLAWSVSVVPVTPTRTRAVRGGGASHDGGTSRALPTLPRVASDPVEPHRGPSVVSPVSERDDRSPRTAAASERPAVTGIGWPKAQRAWAKYAVPPGRSSPSMRSASSRCGSDGMGAAIGAPADPCLGVLLAAVAASEEGPPQASSFCFGVTGRGPARPFPPGDPETSSASRHGLHRTRCRTPRARTLHG